MALLEKICFLYYDRRSKELKIETSPRIKCFVHFVLLYSMYSTVNINFFVHKIYSRIITKLFVSLYLSQMNQSIIGAV